MSTRKSHKGKYNKRASKSNDENEQNGASNPEDLTPIIYKYPGRFATLNRTILLNENLTINEILTKVSLSTDSNPPEPRKVFEAYFFDEIHPFINKHAQETINSKKEIGKSWEQQHERFKRVYIKRAEILRTKWIEMKHGHAEDQENSSKSYSVTNHHHHYQKYDKHNKRNNNSDEPPPKAVTIIFKYYSVHSSAKTNRHIFITSPTKSELLAKVNIALRENPISAKELFEIYYYDEILPFLKKSGQQSIRGKKDLAKVWQIQTKTFKGLYEDRARILLEEWQKLRKETKKSKKSRTQKMLEHSPKTLSPKNSKVSEKGKRVKKIATKVERMECSLIRTLLNFLLLIECGMKEQCFLLLVDDERQRHLEYRKLGKYLKESAESWRENFVYFHLRLFVHKFEADSLRLHTSRKLIKLCFVHPLKLNEELIIFELAFNKLIPGLDERINGEEIEANLDDETGVLANNIPIILSK